MATDYAARILSSEQAAEPAGKDYAASLVRGADQNLVGAGDSIAQAKKSGISIDDVDIVNRDVGINHPSIVSAGALAKAALADDPDTKLSVYAKALFPNDPRAKDRFRMTDEGEAIYRGNDGKWRRATPGGALGAIEKVGADVVGKFAPIAGGAIGGTVAGGPIVGVAGAALGAFAGEGVRKALSGVFLDESQTTSGNLKAMGAEGAWGGVGSAIGAGAVKYVDRGLARDFSRMDPAAVADITGKARRAAIDLNPAQTSNLSSVKGKFEALARLPQSADIIDQGMRRQAQQANDATYRFLQSISPKEGLEEIGADAVNSFGKLISQHVKERADAARPLYEKAFSAGVNLTPETSSVLKGLMKTDAYPAAVREGIKLAKNEGLDISDPSSSLLRAHYSKLVLDDLIAKDVRQTGGAGTTYRQGLIKIKDKLLEEMDRMSPEYEAARAEFAHFSATVEAIRTGIVGRIANLKPEKVNQAARLMFQPGSSPNTVARTRELASQAGMQADYDALLKSYLQQSFEKAGREFKSGSGGMVGQAPSWRAAMLGDPSQASVLKAAMDGRQWAAFNELTDVFEAMGRVSGKGNSITMPMQEAAAELRRQAGTSLPSKVDSTVRFWDWPRAWGNYLTEVKRGDHAERMAQIMTSVDGMKKLKELVRLPPDSAKFIQKAGTLLGVTAGPMPSPDEQ